MTPKKLYDSNPDAYQFQIDEAQEETKIIADFLETVAHAVNAPETTTYSPYSDDYSPIIPTILEEDYDDQWTIIAHARLQVLEADDYINDIRQAWDDAEQKKSDINRSNAGILDDAGFNDEWMAKAYGVFVEPKIKSAEENREDWLEVYKTLMAFMAHDALENLHGLSLPEELQPKLG